MLDERVRSSLYRQLTAEYGEEEATAVVEAVAALHDDDLPSRREITREFIAVRAEMATEFAAVRTEMAELRVGVADVRSEIHQMGQKIVMWMVPTMATLTGLSWAAARFG